MTVRKKAPPMAPSIDIEKKLNMNSPLVARVAKMVKAYEKWQGELKDRRFVAVRTRQAIVRKGVKQTVVDAITERPSDGFQKMVAEGKAKMTYEWIALEHPKVFTKEILQQARDRLDRFGVKQYPGWVKPEPKAKAKPLELQPIPAGAQAILDEAKKPRPIKQGRGKRAPLAEAEPKILQGGGRVEAEPEKKGRGWNLRGRPKLKPKVKDMADATT